MYIYYIQKEHYILAETNGIPRTVLDSRVRYLGWDIDRACREPVNNKIKSLLNKEISDKLKENNITVNAFWKRVKAGWNIEDACSIKPYTKKEAIMKANKTRRTITEEQYLLAEEKGISRNTFRIRIARGWGFKKAIETPIT